MNIFVIETPLQLLNAIEAKQRFPHDETFLFFYSIFSKNVFVPLLELAHCFDNTTYYKEEIIDWSNPNISRFRQLVRRMRIDRIVKACHGVNYLFLGNYVRAHMRHIANNVKYENLILLDDGTDTLLANSMRHNCTAISSEVDKVSLIRTLKRRFESRYLEFDVRELPSVTFFTTYDLQIRNSDFLIKNDYRNLKKWASEQYHTDDVYFLGQPLVDDGFMSKETYCSYLGEVRDHVGLENLVYVPHPRESAKSLSYLVERFGIQIRKFNVPIEAELLLGGQRPQMLASFCSTALDNCRLIFGDDLVIRAFYIEQKDLLSGHQFIDKIYTYLQEKICGTFNVVKLHTSSSTKPLTSHFL